MGDKKKFNIELFLGIVATFVAFLSIMIMVWERIEIREHNQLSVKPILVFDRNITLSQTENSEVTDKTISLVIKNAGLGPAIVKEFEIRIYNDRNNYKSFTDWTEALTDFYSGGKVPRASTYSPGDVLTEGIEDEVVQVILDNSKPLPNVKVYMKYESIYKEEFEILSEKVD